MSLRVCLDCSAAFAVGVPRCPHCGSERHAEQGSALALGIQASVPIEEDHMPKITRFGGPSVAGEPVPVEGGEQPSAGSSGETSSEKPSTKPAPSETETPSPAPKTGSRSKRARTAGSSARSAGGGRADAESETGSADA
ncbi:hypothetical protein [Streptomyces sp. NPDC055733]